VADRFLTDLKATVEYVKTQPASHGGLAPIYGMAATIPFRGMVNELLSATSICCTMFRSISGR
jgi:hypothetical protein